MVRARRAHRVGGDHVPFGVRGVAEAREAGRKRRRRGGGRQGEERGRKGRLRRRRFRSCGRPGPPRNPMRADGAIPGNGPRPQGGERPDLVDRLAGERDALRDARSGRRRRPGSRGIAGTRDGEEDHDGGNDPPEEGAHRAAFMKTSSWIHSVLPPLSIRRPGNLVGADRPVLPGGKRIRPLPVDDLGERLPRMGDLLRHRDAGASVLRTVAATGRRGQEEEQAADEDRQECAPAGRDHPASPPERVSI